MNEPWESRLPFMYLDIRKLVTVAVGNLLPTPESAAVLPFRHVDGTRATPADIVAEYHHVAAQVHMAPHGGGHFRSVTKLRLSETAIDELVFAKLAAVSAQLRARFSGFERFCSDAQAGLCSMTWAMGDGRFADFPKFCAAIHARDFVTASRECHIESRDNGGVEPRNRANRILFLNAARVYADELEPEALYFPRSLEDELETKPELPDAPSDPTVLVEEEVLPVLEQDGGASRRVATLDAAVEAMRDYQRRRGRGD